MKRNKILATVLAGAMLSAYPMQVASAVSTADINAGTYASSAEVSVSFEHDSYVVEPGDTLFAVMNIEADVQVQALYVSLQLDPDNFEIASVNEWSGAFDAGIMASVADYAGGATTLPEADYAGNYVQSVITCAPLDMTTQEGTDPDEDLELTIVKIQVKNTAVNGDYPLNISYAEAVKSTGEAGTEYFAMDTSSTVITVTGGASPVIPPAGSDVVLSFDKEVYDVKPGDVVTAYLNIDSDDAIQAIYASLQLDPESFEITAVEEWSEAFDAGIMASVADYASGATALPEADYAGNFVQAVITCAPFAMSIQAGTVPDSELPLTAVTFKVKDSAVNGEHALNISYAEAVKSTGTEGTVYFTMDTVSAVVNVTGGSDAPSFLLGDVNLDGSITPTDAALALSAYADSQTTGSHGLAEIPALAADVNLDGNITPTDAASILSYYAYLSTTTESPVQPIEQFLGLVII